MPYRSVSHYHALLAELVRRGGRVTYQQFMRRYGLAYDYDGFAHAVWKARTLGLVKPGAVGKGQPIVADEAATCPCCGRRLRKY